MRTKLVVPVTVRNTTPCGSRNSSFVTGATLAPGAPVALFPKLIGGGSVDQGEIGRPYDVAPDGRFLINTVLDEAAAPITLIHDRQPDAKK